MNLIEAIKSGKPFRRKGWGYYLNSRDGGSLEFDSILATDWEIQEQKIELTWRQVQDALHASALGSYHAKEVEFKEKLGFTEDA